MHSTHVGSSSRNPFGRLFLPDDETYEAYVRIGTKNILLPSRRPSAF